MIFVTTGTFGFAGLIEAVDTMVATGLIDDRVVAQIGHSPYVPSRMEYFRTSTDVQKYMREAQYVISHGGTGSMLELLQMGKRIIGVPNRELADNHQETFLQKLHRDGTILYADRPDAALLHEQIARLGTFRPAAFSFFPPAFVEALKRDLGQAGGPGEEGL